MKSPAYRKIMAEIRRKIRIAEYPPGTPLPSRSALMEEFGVARATVDRAIGDLEESGIVVGRHGSGTYVSSLGANKYRIARIGGELDLHAEMPPEFEMQSFPPSDFFSRGEWKKLFAYDGALFLYPEQESMDLIRATASEIPTTVVNRSPDFAPFISTDFRGAYRDIALERMEILPDAALYFLKSDAHTMAFEYRLEGFLDACRVRKRYYEILCMTSDFAENVRILETHLNADAPMIVISDALRNTGAMMRWAAEKHVEWGKRVFYSDFDNTYAQDVWGIAVTSFRQDDEALVRGGTRMLLEMLETGGKVESKLIPAVRRNGTT